MIIIVDGDTFWSFYILSTSVGWVISQIVLIPVMAIALQPCAIYHRWALMQEVVSFTPHLLGINGRYCARDENLMWSF